MSESLQATENFRQMWSDRKRKEQERLANMPSSVSVLSLATLIIVRPSLNAFPVVFFLKIVAKASKTPVNVHQATPESFPKVAQPSVLSSPPSPSSQSPSAYNTRHERPVFEEIHQLGKTVLDVCRRGTVSCLNVLSGVVQGIIHAARMVLGDRDGGDGRPSGDL